MSGPTLTVTVLPTVESAQPLRPPSRSSSPSTPDRLSGPDTIQAQSHTESQQLAQAAPSNTLSQSATSPPGLSTFDVPSFDFGSDFDATFSFSNTLLTDIPDEKPTIIPDETNMAGPEPTTDKPGKRRATANRPQIWTPSSKQSPNNVEDSGEITDQKESGNDETPSNSKFLSPSSPQDTYRHVSDSIASLAKRSWLPGSRSPSPGKKDELTTPSESRPTRERSTSNSSIMKLKKSSRKRPVSPADSDSNKSTESRGRFGSYFNKIKQKQPGILAKGKVTQDHDSPASSIASLAPPSTETRQSRGSETSSSTFPEDIVLQTKLPQMRDALWSAFRALDTDCHKFLAKPTSQKMNIVRSALVPFLKSYGNHSSNKMLHHEDLERRALILNKWWIGLLELLEGKGQQPVAGVDRPLLLEAMTSIMMRPEWRQCNASFTPLADRNPAESIKHSHDSCNRSSISLNSTDSDYLAESARHNVKTMFIANLVAQMAVVVDRLSLRHAPLSLVNFAGKACAYAFFFAPGIADVLVRLWSLNSDCIRRVADEFGLPRLGKGESDEIVALFPPFLDKLGWSSSKVLSHSLKRVAALPLTASRIAWRGAWISRWTGRDADLFFIFCKYYYALVEEFLPPGLPLVEKARAPGFVLVNAQVLSILDSTIHRQAAVEALLGPPLADTLHGADASATALPAPPNHNIMKGMNENRLIVLLKDMLCTASMRFVDARHTFAEAFMAIMRSSAKRTSQFDHNACFTICDFLEESLVVYDNFVDIQKPQAAYVDWPFWFDVCKKILESNNTMSEIRVLALIFSIWETIANDQSRKETVCLEWLLQEDVFNKLFNNWCPMVRAYYMRLLCWRICRDVGNANDSDAKIFTAVYSRLKLTWSHYLWLKQMFEQQGKIPPSTAPSFPTPGKRFMIIRTELATVQPGLMMSFDSTSPNSIQSHAAANPPTDFESMDTVEIEPAPPKKKVSFLGKFFSFTSSSSSASDLETVRGETTAARTRPSSSSKTKPTPSSSDSDSTSSSPTYEALQYVFKFTLSWNTPGTMPPPNRILTRPRLPGPAQSWVAAKGQVDGLLTPAASRPAPTRAVSGSSSPGLINSARNANPSEVLSSTFDRRPSFGQTSTTDRNNDDARLRTPVSPNVRGGTEEATHRSPVSPAQESINLPVEPKGVVASGVKYAGRALAEWSLVVAECNSFIDRRREEGVMGLGEVEVPALGVEGFRKLA